MSHTHQLLLRAVTAIVLLLSLGGGQVDASTRATSSTTPIRPSTEVRGGFFGDNEDEETKAIAALRKYRLQQQQLLQLRSTILSEALAARGVPVTTLVDVATNQKPPERVDWDCALSTLEEPKSCLYSFDAEPDTKVIAPMGTTEWISLSALNRLYRTDPSKVEPMWHTKYDIRKSWFREDSPFSVLQHLGTKGMILSILLSKEVVLTSLLAISALMVTITFLPLVEFVVSRILVSSLIWLKWPSWARFAHAALPLKLLLVQMGFKALAKVLTKGVSHIRDALVEMECTHLERHLPLTVGPNSDDPFVVAGFDDDYTDDDEYSDDGESDLGLTDAFDFDD